MICLRALWWSPPIRRSRRAAMLCSSGPAMTLSRAVVWVMMSTMSAGEVPARFFGSREDSELSELAVARVS